MDSGIDGNDEDWREREEIITCKHTSRSYNIKSCFFYRFVVDSSEMTWTRLFGVFKANGGIHGWGTTFGCLTVQGLF
jgi:hypothetical protein